MKALSVRAKILTAFTVVSLICTLGISFLALTVFWQRFSRVTGAYLNDVTMQSTVNMKKELTDIEDMNVRILSSSTVQEQLRRVNAGKSTSFQLRGIRETILRELEQITLFGGSSISLSVFSLDGTEFTVHRVTGKPVQRIFPEDEIYEANGSRTDKSGDIEEVATDFIVIPCFNSGCQVASYFFPSFSNSIPSIRIKSY